MSDESNELEKRFKNYDPGQHFTIVSQKLAQDKRLSWGARGLFVYLSSNRHDYTFHESVIFKHASNGRRSTRRALHELIHYGYLAREQHINKKTRRFGQTTWSLYYVPNDRYNGNYKCSKKRADGNASNGHASNGKAHNGSSTDGNRVSNKYQGNKNQSNKNQGNNYVSLNNYVPLSREKALNIKTIILNMFKKLFHRNFAITNKTKLYLNNWINQIKSHAHSEKDIKVGIKHLKYSMIYTVSGIKSTSPNAIAEYINNCFTDPSTVKFTGIDYSAFIDFGKNYHASCDEILIKMHELFNTNIASFMNQRNVLKLIQKYGALKLNKAVEYTSRHAVHNDNHDIPDIIMSHPVKYIKKTLDGNAW